MPFIEMLRNTTQSMIPSSQSLSLLIDHINNHLNEKHKYEQCGYPLPHLLAMHFLAAKSSGKGRLKLFFSTESIVIRGKSLNQLWDALVKGESLAGLAGHNIESIQVLRYAAP